MGPWGIYLGTRICLHLLCFEGTTDLLGEVNACMSVRWASRRAVGCDELDHTTWFSRLCKSAASMRHVQRWHDAVSVQPFSGMRWNCSDEVHHTSIILT
jgi:hypothetical protein